MNDLYEIVFSDVPEVNLFPLVSKLLPNKNLISVLSNEESEGPQIDFSNEPGLEKSAIERVKSGYAISGMVSKIESAVFALNRVGLRIICYDGKLDLELNFVLHDQHTLRNEDLSKFFYEIAEEFNVKEVYGGMEPARDIETRIFSGLSLGPILL